MHVRLTVLIPLNVSYLMFRVGRELSLIHRSCKYSCLLERSRALLYAGSNLELFDLNVLYFLLPYHSEIFYFDGSLVYEYLLLWRL